MASTIPVGEKVEETFVKWVRSRPMTFDEFLDAYGGDDEVELIDGTAVERMSAQIPHESLLAWLFHVMGVYADRRALGRVWSSRVAVEINRFRGRLPDLVFVRAGRLDIVREKAIFGVPDLVLEIISPNDRPSDIHALETDYRILGVPEIVFLDQRKRQARLLRKRETDYEETTLREGPLRLETIAGFSVELGGLFDEPRPDLFDTLVHLLESE
jgi:Uma2 family endonuclease